MSPLPLVALVLVVSLTRPVGATTPVQAAVERGQAALSGKRYVTAAEAMEEAYRLDPRPVWLSNAGYARLMAGQHDTAITLLADAVADPDLAPTAKRNASERLEHARAIARLVAQARAAADDPKAAAEIYLAVLDHVDVGAYQLVAASLFEQAADYTRAREHYQAALAHQDLDAADQARATDAIVRVVRAAAHAEPEPESHPATPAPVAGDATLGWVLIGTGIVAAGGAAVSLWRMASLRDDFEGDVFVDADGARAYRNTRQAAQAQEDEARSWWLGGLVAGGIAVVATTLGTWLVLDAAPTPSSGTVISGAPLAGGGLVTLTGGF